MSVLLDRSVQLASLDIQGTLVFADRDLELRSGWIVVRGAGGRLQIGSSPQPFAARATITLTGGATDADVMGCGSKVLCVMGGGTLALHGASRDKVSWSKLTQTVAPGASSLVLSDPVNWSAGDDIVIAPTGYDPTQTSVRTVAALSADRRTVTLNQPVAHPHFGQLQTFAGRVLDSRAAVGLLSRNIVVRSDPASIEPFRNDRLDLHADPGEAAADPNRRFGGHVMVMNGKAYVEGVEFRDLGQATRLGRYAFHWHLSGNVQGQFVRDSSVRNSYTRGIVVHSAQFAQVAGNVVYNTASHGVIFSEVGDEYGNTFERNLSLRTVLLPQSQRIFKDDPSQPLNSDLARIQDEHRPSNFWGINPSQRLIGNIAAGGEGNGFHFLSGGPRGADPQHFAFRDNVAHSSYQSNGGNDMYPPNARGHGLFFDAMGGRPVDVYNFTAFKNHVSGAWIEGRAATLRQSILADNNAGVTSFINHVEDLVIVGRTANGNGTPQTLGEGAAGGIHLMRFQGGVKRATARNVSVIDFPGGSANGAAVAMNDNMVAFDTAFSAMRLTNTRPVLMLGTGNPPSGAMRDVDGSLSGRAGWLVADNPIYSAPGCQANSAWRAMTCPTGTRFTPVEISAWSPRNGPRRYEFWDLMVRRSDGAAGNVHVHGLPDGFAALPSGLHYDISPGVSNAVDRPASRALKVGTAAIFGLSEADVGTATLSLPVSTSQVWVYFQGTRPFYPDDRDFYGPDFTRALTPAASREALAAGDGSQYFFDATTRRVHVKAGAASMPPVYLCETATCQ